MSQSASDGGGPIPVQVLEEITSLWGPMTIQNYVVVSSFALMVYDYFLTLPLEISEIWRHKWSVTKVIFLCNRYPEILSNLAYLLFTTWAKTDKALVVFSVTPYKNPDFCRCKDLEYLSNAVIPLISLSQSCMFTLRTFALYNKNWGILVLLGTLTLTALAVGIGLQIGTGAATSSQIFGVTMPVRCISLSSKPDEIQKWTLATYIVSITFDTLVFILTLARTLKLAMQARRIEMKNSLGILLMEDGILYYTLVCLPSIAGMVLYALVIQRNSTISIGDAEANFTFYYNVIVWSMTNRLILNLCHTVRNPLATNETSAFETHIAEIKFATNSVLGNIGAPLRVDLDEDESVGTRISDTRENDIEMLATPADEKNLELVTHGNEIEEIQDY